MKPAKTAFALALFVIASLSSYPARVLADTDPSLSPVLIGNWQYSRSGTVMGTIRFDGLTAGTIYDNRYGTGSFTGKFVSRNVFEGRATLPKTNNNSKINIVIDFYRPANNKTAWSFKGWVSDYTNGAFDQARKL